MSVTPDHVVLREVSDAVSRMLMGTRTFYAHVLVRMRREVSREIPTMAVRADADGVALLVNPEFWRRTLVSDDFREGVLVHEVLHVVLRHLDRAEGVTDRQLFNVAADLAVNRLVGRRFLPAGALFVEDMPEEWDLPDDGTAEEYYEILRKQRPPATHLAFGDGEGKAGRGSHETWPGGSQATGPSDVNDGFGSDGIRRSAMNDLVQAAVRDTKATHGSIPAGLQRAIDAAVPRRSRTDWRRMMHLFGTSGMTTYLKPTIMSPSRRFGTVPGVRVRQRQSLAVAVDTSGSIEADLLATFFGEVHALWRLGIDVTVIECDAAIRPEGVWRYRGRMALRAEGGGGTDFDPPIEWANSHAVDGLVYLTDGDGGRSLPCRRRLLWMVTEERNATPRAVFVQPGETVCHLDPRAGGSR